MYLLKIIALLFSVLITTSIYEQKIWKRKLHMLI